MRLFVIISLVMRTICMIDMQRRQNNLSNMQIDALITDFPETENEGMYFDFYAV